MIKIAINGFGRIGSIILFSLALIFLTATSVLAQDIDDPLSIPGRIQSTGTLFEITDSEYLNISLESSEEITILLESAPKIISLIIEASSVSNSTDLTISGLEPNKTYYRYDNSYKNETVLVSTLTGTYTFNQDLIHPHHVWFQEARGTIFIPEDCDTYGSWNAANSTCTLNQDLTENVEITESNTILDCNTHTITGIGYGIYLNNRESVTVKKCIVTNFSWGIYLYSSSNNTLINNTASLNIWGGVGLYRSSNNNTITSNTAYNNTQFGIAIEFNSNGNIVANNIANRNRPYGIFIGSSSNNNLNSNNVFDNMIGISLGYSPGNTLTNNIISNNYYNFDVYGLALSHFPNNIDTTNKINGKPIYYLVSRNNLIIDSGWGDIGYLGIVDSNNITVKDIILPSHNGQGVLFVSLTNSRIENVKSENNNDGIVLVGSSDVALINNKVLNNSIGISIQSYSHDNTVTTNVVSDNGDGIFIYGSSSNNVVVNNIINSNGRFGVYLWAWSSMNKIYHNNFIDNGSKPQAADYTGYDNFFDNGHIEGGNYWSDYDTPGEGCIDTNNDNFCDAPYVFTGGQDRYPFMRESGWVVPVNQPPIFSNPNQYKSDSQTPINEGQTTTESTVIFKAVVNDPDNDKAKLQVQIKEVDHEWQDIIESGLVNSGSEAVVTKYGLIDGQYRWHARAMDERGATSEWQDFGVPGNVDFEVKLVPLYTQVWSPHPSWSETDEWDGLQYADGKSRCGFAIKDCGCAITSTIMILRFYDITVAKDNNDVNPLNLNNWLVANNGYDSGDLDWDKIDDYSREPQSNIKRLHYVGPINSENTDLLDIYLANLQPTILKVYPIVQGELSPHFIVADGKLTNTYTIRDPAWYNTRYLTQASSSYVYNYNNNFSQLRLFSPTVVVRGIIHLHLASPAELLVTDPLGRKLGKDPIANIEYNEIPGGVYYPEGIGNPFAETPTPVEEAKNIWIPNPLDGNYDVKIIGTGIGGYVADFSIYDQTGESQDVSYEGTTTTDNVQEFDLSYSVETVEEVELYRIVDIDIKPGSDPNSINLKSKGVTPVAVLADEFFDAEGVVIDSILFVGVSPKKGNLEDVDNDGDIDLILHFETQDLQLTLGDVEATLTGQLTNGTLIKGVDFVRIVPSEKENKGGKKNSLLIGIIPLCIIGIGFLIRKKKIRFSDKIVETIRKIKIKK